MLLCGHTASPQTGGQRSPIRPRPGACRGGIGNSWELTLVGRCEKTKGRRRLPVGDRSAAKVPGRSPEARQNVSVASQHSPISIVLQHRPRTLRVAGSTPDEDQSIFQVVCASTVWKVWRQKNKDRPLGVVSSVAGSRGNRVEHRNYDFHCPTATIMTCTCWVASPREQLST